MQFCHMYKLSVCVLGAFSSATGSCQQRFLVCEFLVGSGALMFGFANMVAVLRICNTLALDISGFRNLNSLSESLVNHSLGLRSLNSG